MSVRMNGIGGHEFGRALESIPQRSATWSTLAFICGLLAVFTTTQAASDDGPTDPAVNESSGAANYRISIAVPPGPGGLAPTLELSYSSRGGDGPYGVGWDLSLGEIVCSSRFGVPDYANCEQYELNGQLLTVDPATANRYHPFVETFEKIEYVDSSDSWRVTSPDGTIMRYGVGSDARILAGAATAKWLLSEVQDPFGNMIFITYDTSDVGTRYPALVTYGAGATKATGKRSVEFVFGELRPDPIRDFAGGIERVVTKRLTDIKVHSYGNLVRRYAFGYDLAGVDYSTGRSRLAWAQQFGDDCAGPISGCVGLPRQEFEYTDPNDDGLIGQYSKFTRDENYVVPFAGNRVANAVPVRVADVNGDGLADLIYGGISFGSNFNENDQTRVEINTGTGFANPAAEFPTPADLESAAWTTALETLPVVRPRADFSQILPVLVPGSPEAGAHSNLTAGIHDAEYSVVSHPVMDAPPAANGRPEVQSSSGARTTMQPGVQRDGWIEAMGRLNFVDINADGYADIVVSVQLSGVDKVLDSSGNPITPARQAGNSVQKVFLNKANPADPGWYHDGTIVNGFDADDLARGLPPFGIVQYESPYGAEVRVPFDPDYEFSNSFFSDPCNMRGLNGWWTPSHSVIPESLSPDVCYNLVNLDPRFQDFNGDGYVDLMVLELSDPDALYQGYAYYRGENAPELDHNFARSRVYVQNPNASNTEDRWVPAPEFDLPNVPFQQPAYGGQGVGDDPFAHSQPWLVPAAESGGTGCPGPGGFEPNWEYCAPLSINMNYGVQIVDLNRDGLADITWSLFQFKNQTDGGPELITQGVFLNTGSGWCSSVPELAVEVGAACPEASIYLPPSFSTPAGISAPVGYAFTLGHDGSSGVPTGSLADLNADGFLDYIQTHVSSGWPGTSAWLFNPAGVTELPQNIWVRDDRYDIDIDYNLINIFYSDSAGFTTGDFNGDGAADIVGDDLRDENAVQHPQAFISRSGHSDLLKLVRNGMGGKIAITYDSAILQRDLAGTGLETVATDHAALVGEEISSMMDVVRWSASPVVTEIRTASPNRAADPSSPLPGFGPPTTYKYAQPRYCPMSRSDLGYRVVEKTRPAGDVVTSKFYQAHGRTGRKSEVIVSDGGVEMNKSEEIWEIQPDVPALVPGSIAHSMVHVGRLAETRSRNLYAGGISGAETIRTLYYDDAYGYNFVSKAIESRPTGTLATLRDPISDSANSIFGLVAEEKVFDHDPSGLGDLDFLHHMTMTFQAGRVASSGAMVKARGDSGGGTEELQTMEYDSFGNLTKQTVVSTSGDRVTEFCYDGDGGWCPDPANSLAGVAQDSHSVRVGMKDPKGGISTFIPDPGSGSIVETYSTYTDIPATWAALDVFGRPINNYVHNGTNWIRTKKTSYHDATLAQPLIVESMVLPFAGASVLTERIWSGIVTDGFGGVWKEIKDSPSGSVGTLTYHHPELRRTEKSLPIACASMWCAGLDGDGEASASKIESDALGRAIRQDTPYGFSIFDYSAVTKNVGPGPTGVQLDQVLVKNGKGDLIERAMDGDRVVRVMECDGTVSASATDISGVACGGPETYYTYESTGELSTIHDALSPSSYDDPNHYLRYHFDTLGRILEIEDPALDGTGHTLTSYDHYGNKQSTTNARGQQRTHAYDELDRLVGVTTPAGEVDYTISYRTNEMQSSGDSSNDYVRTLTYDGLGRVATEKMSIRNRLGFFQDFHTDFEHDLIGRTTRVLYPAMHYEAGEWIDTIVRFEYDKGYLEQICDLGSAADCDAATAKFVSQAQFDLLGRPDVFTFPAGTRTFEYTSDTHRLSKDEFVSATYQYTRNYAAFDEIGNVLSITGSESASAALDMNETYAYDERNRLSQWTKEGSDYLFQYDELGNLVLHANETQEYTDAERPHAITSRGEVGSEITYQYDADGNVLSITGGTSPQAFEYNSANQIICLQGASPSCDYRVAYDVAGKRVAEYPSGKFKAYIGNSFLYEDDQYNAKANVEVMLDGKRIALKRFDPQIRGATAGLLPITIPAPWIFGGLVGVGVLLLVWGIRENAFVLVEARPLRAATAVGAATALALMVPSYAFAGGGGIGSLGAGISLGNVGSARDGHGSRGQRRGASSPSSLHAVWRDSCRAGRESPYVLCGTSKERRDRDVLHAGEVV